MTWVQKSNQFQQLSWFPNTFTIFEILRWYFSIKTGRKIVLDKLVYFPSNTIIKHQHALIFAVSRKADKRMKLIAFRVFKINNQTTMPPLNHMSTNVLCASIKCKRTLPSLLDHSHDWEFSPLSQKCTPANFLFSLHVNITVHAFNLSRIGLFLVKSLDRKSN